MIHRLDEGLLTHVHVANINVDLGAQWPQQIPKHRTNDGYGLDTACDLQQRKTCLFSIFNTHQYLEVMLEVSPVTTYFLLYVIHFFNVSNV